MFPTSTNGLVAAALGVLLGCATRGYYVQVRAKPIPDADRDRTLGAVERQTRERGFVAAFERRSDAASFPGAVFSSYQKRRSDGPSDRTEVHIEFHAPEKRILVDIENRFKGMDAPVKAEIDALGEAYAAELASVAGREGVAVSSGERSFFVFQ